MKLAAKNHSGQANGRYDAARCPTTVANITSRNSGSGSVHSGAASRHGFTQSQRVRILKAPEHGQRSCDARRCYISRRDPVRLYRLHLPGGSKWSRYWKLSCPSLLVRHTLSCKMKSLACFRPGSGLTTTFLLAAQVSDALSFASLWTIRQSRSLSRRSSSQNATTIPAPVQVAPSQYWEGNGWWILER